GDVDWPSARRDDLGHRDPRGPRSVPEGRSAEGTNRVGTRSYPDHRDSVPAYRVARSAGGQFRDDGLAPGQSAILRKTPAAPGFLWGRRQHGSARCRLPEISRERVERATASAAHLPAVRRAGGRPDLARRGPLLGLRPVQAPWRRCRLMDPLTLADFDP